MKKLLSMILAVAMLLTVGSSVAMAEGEPIEIDFWHAWAPITRR